MKPGPQNTPEQDARDRRIEVAAARETALTMAIRVGVAGADITDLTRGAMRFEKFLLDHPANGEQALELAVTWCVNRSVVDIAHVAWQFADYLENSPVMASTPEAPHNAA